MKIIFGLIVATAVIFLGYLLLQMGGATPQDQSVSVSNVSIVDGQQIVEISAKAGYTPRVSQVKAGLPTVLRVDTQGTFDCSSQIRVPSLDISRSLPPSGVTDIALGTLEPGVLQGTCGMGMYPFELNVKN
ncbi:MAG: cupredoxin domain-containing protein [Candidatus Moraniibacteriota bacterium]|nr:MAG: cupredoxin domain-containing protein [Candidatus Moranbacteria bacterium]